jgi:hypothetical protein
MSSQVTRRSELLAQLEEALTLRTELRGRRDEAATIYRSTTDGLAESLRAIELATSDDPRAIRHMMKMHVAGEQEARAEYALREARWGIRAGDGPLYAVPLGESNRTLAMLLVRWQVMGTYRITPGPPAATTAVHLLRIDATGNRTRAKLFYPHPVDTATALTLDQLFTAVRTDRNEQRKLARFFADHYPQFTAAVTTPKEETH